MESLGVGMCAGVRRTVQAGVLVLRRATETYHVTGTHSGVRRRAWASVLTMRHACILRRTTESVGHVQITQACSGERGRVGV